MHRVGLWKIGADGPSRLAPASLDLEQRLEEWIERDPSLLEPGLTILARQMRLDAGLLDLLALDPQGRWVVIEIKRATLRRDTIAQGLDYAACIATMPAGELSAKVNAYLTTTANPHVTLETLLNERTGEDTAGDARDVFVYVVGTGRDAGLERVVNFLNSNSVNVRAFTFEVFAVGNDSVLVRELTDGESLPTAASPAFTSNLDGILSQAELSMAPVLRNLVELAQRHGLVARRWKNCVMLAPARHRGRALITVWPAPQPDGRVKIYLSPETFVQFFPVTEEQVRTALGQNGGGSRLLDADAIATIAAGLPKLLANSPEDEAGLGHPSGESTMRS